MNACQDLATLVRSLLPRYWFPVVRSLPRDEWWVNCAPISVTHLQPNCSCAENHQSNLHGEAVRPTDCLVRACLMVSCLIPHPSSPCQGWLVVHGFLVVGSVFDLQCWLACLQYMASLCQATCSYFLWYWYSYPPALTLPVLFLSFLYFFLLPSLALSCS